MYVHLKKVSKTLRGHVYVYMCISITLVSMCIYIYIHMHFEKFLSNVSHLAVSVKLAQSKPSVAS